ncbi:MAG: hypothetical protein JWN62_3991 [Acidimicrobiales bacterium]|nr:hypothetical protein [Acidimicrobiales bacterium]
MSDDDEFKALLEHAGEPMPASSRASIRTTIAAALEHTLATTADRGSSPTEVVVEPIAIGAAAFRRAQRRWFAVVGAGAVAAAAVAAFVVTNRSDRIAVTDPDPTAPLATSSPTLSTVATTRPAAPTTIPAGPGTTATMPSTSTDTEATTSASTGPTATTGATTPPSIVPVVGMTVPQLTPRSVSFPTVLDGWYVGSAVDNADGSTAAVLLHTTDGGVSWQTVDPPAPLSASDGSLSVGFADEHNGWLLGNDTDGNSVLVATHDGGASWAVITLDSGNASPMALATANGAVHVVAFDSAADGSTTLRIFTSAVAADDFAMSDLAIQPGAGPVFDASIALGGAGGWIAYNDRVLVDAARLVDGRWVAWQPPCSVADPEADVASVAATNDGTTLIVACTRSDFADPPVSIRLARSTDGGTAFANTSPLPESTQANDGTGTTPAVSFIVLPDADTIVVGYERSDGRFSIVRSVDGGSTWTEVQRFSESAQPVPAYEYTITRLPGAPIVVQTPPGIGIVSTDGGATWDQLATTVVGSMARSDLRRIDLETGRIFGFDAGNAPGTNSPSPETLLAVVIPVLGPPSLDTGWYTVPVLANQSEANCWVGSVVRVIIWGDLSFLFADDGTHQYLTNWQIGTADPARGIDLVVPKPAATPTGIVTTPAAGDSVPSTFGIGGSVAALESVYPSYAPHLLGGLNSSLRIQTDGADTITEIGVENGC